MFPNQEPSQSGVSSQLVLAFLEDVAAVRCGLTEKVHNAYTSRFAAEPQYRISCTVSFLTRCFAAQQAHSGILLSKDGLVDASQVRLGLASVYAERLMSRLELL